MVGLASIIVLGIGAQWLAWRLKLPSILLLLLSGFVAGPVTGLVDPDRLLGQSLFPVVSISVGIILFEGGLTLRLPEVMGMRRVVIRLITIGALITWVIGTLAAYFIIDVALDLALLIGAIFVVTGPTVVIPLLKHVRVNAPTGPVLRWEGILIDPVGATLAVLVFEVILIDQAGELSPALILVGILRVLLVGGLIGFVSARLLIEVIRRRWVPEFLHNALTLMVIVAAFTLSNELQVESGLLTTTLMGVVLANQRTIEVKRLSHFNEEIGILLLSSLFVLLAARLDLDSLSSIGVRALAFFGVLVFIARPLSVYVSTWRSQLTWRERLFLAWLAPRGIVAVAVTSLFALELAEHGNPEAERMVPLTFLVVIGTVLIYGLTAGPLASRLGLVLPEPHGFLIVGAHDWARTLAARLRETGRDVLLIDTNWSNVNAAKLDGLPAVYASVLSDHALDEIDLSRMGNLLALTRNDEVNALAALRFAEIFGRENIYQLPLQAEESRKSISTAQHGRCLFSSKATFPYLVHRFNSGAVIKKVKLTQEFAYRDFLALYGDGIVPLFLVHESGEVSVFTTDTALTPRAGQTLLALVDPLPDEAATLPDAVPSAASETPLSHL